MLAQAVLDLFEGATFGIGPPIEDGFYYDFQLADGATFTPEDLERIDARMREIIKEKQPFLRDEIPDGEARELFAAPPVQAGDHRGHGRRPHVGDARGPRAHLREPAELHRPLPGPPRPRHGSARATSS